MRRSRTSVEYTLCQKFNNPTAELITLGSAPSRSRNSNSRSLRSSASLSRRNEIRGESGPKTARRLFSPRRRAAVAFAASAGSWDQHLVDPFTELARQRAPDLVVCSHWRELILVFSFMPFPIDVRANADAESNSSDVARFPSTPEFPYTRVPRLRGESSGEKESVENHRKETENSCPLSLLVIANAHGPVYDRSFPVAFCAGEHRRTAFRSNLKIFLFGRALAGSMSPSGLYIGEARGSSVRLD